MPAKKYHTEEEKRTAKRLKWRKKAARRRARRKADPAYDAQCKSWEKKCRQNTADRNPGYAAERTREWRKRHPDKVAARLIAVAERRKSDPEWREEQNARDRERRRQSPEKGRENTRRWRAANKARRRAYTNEYNKARYRTDPSYKACVLMRNRMNRYMGGSRPCSAAFENLLGCSWDDFLIHISSQFSEGMTWENWAIDGWHIDHIRPLCTFDHTDPAQVAEAWHHTNMRPMWAEENVRRERAVA
jgi:hypothetical protein